MEEKELLPDLSRITEPFDLVAALTYMRENGEFIFICTEKYKSVP